MASSNTALEIPLTAIVTQAVTLLYLDRALPRARLLQWKVESLYGSKVAFNDLRGACRNVPGMKIEPPDARKSNFMVLLETPPHGFDGFEDGLEDPIPESRWEEVGEVLSTGSWPSCANTEHQVFVIADHLRTWQSSSDHASSDSNVSPLRDLSFGRALAVVRQSLTTHKFLGKRREILVPYKDSEERERRVNASSRKPTGVSVGERYVADYEGLRACLHFVLHEAGSAVAVSRLKTLFRERLGAELSETALGHLAMADLLSSPELAAEFEVWSESKGTPFICFRGSTASAAGKIATSSSGGGGSSARGGGKSLEALQHYFVMLEADPSMPPSSPKPKQLDDPNERLPEAEGDPQPVAADSVSISCTQDTKAAVADASGEAGTADDDGVAATRDWAAAARVAASVAAAAAAAANAAAEASKAKSATAQATEHRSAEAAAAQKSSDIESEAVTADEGKCSTASDATAAREAPSREAPSSKSSRGIVHKVKLSDALQRLRAASASGFGGGGSDPCGGLGIADAASAWPPLPAPGSKSTRELRLSEVLAEPRWGSRNASVNSDNPSTGVGGDPLSNATVSVVSNVGDVATTSVEANRGAGADADAGAGAVVGYVPRFAGPSTLVAENERDVPREQDEPVPSTPERSPERFPHEDEVVPSTPERALRRLLREDEPVPCTPEPLPWRRALEDEPVPCTPERTPGRRYREERALTPVPSGPPPPRRTLGSFGDCSRLLTEPSPAAPLPPRKGAHINAEATFPMPPATPTDWSAYYQSVGTMAPVCVAPFPVYQQLPSGGDAAAGEHHWPVAAFHPSQPGGIYPGSMISMSTPSPLPPWCAVLRTFIAVPIPRDDVVAVGAPRALSVPASRPFGNGCVDI
eukprot:TRINITY_DN9012_c0_g1_i1.p1 TRINITY_DN9012_c0_g1~~TRINITY_DN9012_c0_g1_i1.p1  ORF type:complete len:919 (+),score=177.74 TRINITY_DN9012_c0_g1_i1:139-2757(+)